MQSSITIHETDPIDLSKVAALQQKRTLAFVNHFVITTVQFMNNFAKKCEMKLMDFEHKLEKINASMVLLEARISSIPEVSKIDSSKPPELHVDEETNTENNEANDNKTKILTESEQNSSSPSNDVKPEYVKFVKMFQVGVPLDAVKLKVSLEGLDPKELDKILGK